MEETNFNVLDQPEYYTQMRYAGFWERFAAVFIDGILLGVVSNVVTFITLGTTSFSDPEPVDPFGEPMAQMSAMLGQLLPSMLIGVVINWLYYAFMESSANQGTLGKMALNIKVTDLNGERISFGRATGRFFAKYLSSLTLLIGYIMAAFTERRQALHDMVASTLVVKK